VAEAAASETGSRGEVEVAPWRAVFVGVRRRRREGRIFFGRTRMCFPDGPVYFVFLVEP
jgi:hypothetical protein